MNNNGSVMRNGDGLLLNRANLDFFHSLSDDECQAVMLVLGGIARGVEINHVIKAASEMTGVSTGRLSEIAILQVGKFWDEKIHRGGVQWMIKK